MAIELIMPQMSYDMREGKLVRWLKKEGDEVKRGEPVAEIETDKAVVEMESFGAGLLRKILVGEGESAPVGQVIAYIGSKDEPIPEAPVKGKAPVIAKEEKVAKGVAAEERGEKAAAAGEMRASPLARRLAEEKGIDLRKVAGTGPDGRITKEDVLAYEDQAKKGAPAKVPAAAEGVPVAGTVALSRMRQAIARTTQQSKRDAPHFYVTTGIDMSRAMALREEVNQTLEGDVRVSVNDLIVKVCAKVLQKYPHFNASYKEDHLDVHPSVNIGIAVAVEEGLILPAVMHCEQKSLVQIARDSKDVVKRAREGHLRQDEYTAGTFSVSNLGMYDVDEFVAIIFPPQAAILAVGTVRQQPVVRDNQVVVRQVMRATLSVDHRVADGAQAAQFLSEVKRLLENPAGLLL